MDTVLLPVDWMGVGSVPPKSELNVKKWNKVCLKVHVFSAHFASTFRMCSFIITPKSYCDVLVGVVFRIRCHLKIANRHYIA